MVQLQANAEFSARLKVLSEATKILDEKGQLLGIFEPLVIAPPGVAAALSPHTHDELRELRKQREGGLPLSEVLKKIGAQ